MINNFNQINKVGFSLEIENLPNHYPLKENVIKWEKQFWVDEIEKDIFKAKIDTTFALYKPMYPFLNDHVDYYKGLRFAGKYIAKHGGWYLDPENLSEEEIFYQNNTTNVSSWKLNNNDEKIKKRYQLNS